MTRELAVAAIAQWIAEHGRQPTYNEWRRRHERPSPRTIEVHCGSWAKAVQAAGGEARSRGEYRRSLLPRPRCERCREPRPRRNDRFCSHRCATLSFYDAIGRKRRYRGQLANGRYRYRVVAEAHLGRRLALGEVVHHIDGDRTNDEPWNLAVFSSQRDHMRFHGQGGIIRAVDGSRWRCERVGRWRLVVSPAG